MVVLGITGSIGMGKTTAAAALRRLRIPVFEADREVHRLLDAKRAEIGKAFPEAMAAGGVDRAKMAAIVFHDAAARQKLESILHPAVRAAEIRFLSNHRARRTPVAALDIPLLFESGADLLCDISITVTAPHFLQRARVLSRPGMSEARFRAILAAQMPDAEKRRRADFVLPTGLGMRPALNRLRRIVKSVKRKSRARDCPRYRNHRA